MVNFIFSRMFLYGLMTLILLFWFMPIKSVDPKVEQEYNAYMEVVKAQCKPNQYFNPIQQIIRFSELEHNVLGVCKTNFLTRYSITFNSNLWDKLSYEDQFQLMLHEFTHCTFLVDHTEDENHFMYSAYHYIPKEETIRQFQEFLKETCGR